MIVGKKGLLSSVSFGREHPRLDVFIIVVSVFAVIIFARLFFLQIFRAQFYRALASGQHEIFSELFPERGEILAYDQGAGAPVVFAGNKQFGFAYADPRKITDAEATANTLAQVFDKKIENEDDAAWVEDLKNRLSKKDDPYEPIMKRVEDDKLNQLDELDLPGIYYVREQSRVYPEGGLGGHILGFVGSDTDGSFAGKYGVEGYFDSLLSGEAGFAESVRDAAGRIIAFAKNDFTPAKDGADIVLTIDRTLQYVVCTKLRDAVRKHGADGGSVIIIEPSTGRILAMCGSPDFDPNEYAKQNSVSVYNNPAIFLDYEPGSVFKPITMSMALDRGVLSPYDTYEDTGLIVIDGHEIKNSDEAAHGTQTMTQVLEQSLNTGAIYSMRKVGRDIFQKYVSDYGFGKLTGIELDTESNGNVSTLNEPSEVYSATASYGQGITVTPLQLAMAYAAIANSGKLMKPMIVDEIRYSDGTVEKRSPQTVRQVISEKAARTLGAMLVSVVERGHGTKAGVSGYYIAGKTGTAQIPRKDGRGYEENAAIGTFAGFGPASDPKFAMVVRIDRPRTTIWAESTAAPLFGDLAKYLIQYYRIPKER
ncbi:MAG: hypothetical protein ACD_76C00120G0003 [uncultured bacterium]|nr:MAG: hypothetical protein ACD_76C00120G0003 [uncultured bacterium]HBD04861.1 hypothetical protein [Candidatus Uhrbacteria bacterium]